MDVVPCGSNLADVELNGAVNLVVMTASAPQSGATKDATDKSDAYLWEMTNTHQICIKIFY